MSPQNSSTCKTPLSYLVLRRLFKHTNVCLQEACEEERQVLHKLLLLVVATLVGLWDVDLRGHHELQLGHEDLVEGHKLRVELWAHHQGADLGQTLRAARG